MTVILIAAVGRNGVIGRDNDLPWYLSADLRRFKALTSGHVVVTGRLNQDSMVSRLGRPLPGRITVVVTRTAGRPGEGPSYAKFFYNHLKRFPEMGSQRP